MQVPEEAEGIGGVEGGGSVAITIDWEDGTLKVEPALAALPQF